MGEEKKEEKKEVKKVEESKKETTNKKEEVKKESKVKGAEKKADKTKDGKKKKKGVTVLVAVLIVAVIAVMIIAGICLTASTPQKTMEAMLNAIKVSNYDEINEAMGSVGLFGEDSSNQETVKLIFEKLSWNVLKVTENGDTATVEMEITNKDFRTIMGNLFQKLLQEALAGKGNAEDAVDTYLLEELRKEDIPVTTITANVEMVKQDGKWQIKDMDNFIYELLPGLKEVMNSFSGQ